MAPVYIQIIWLNFNYVNFNMTNKINDIVITPNHNQSKCTATLLNHEISSKKLTMLCYKSNWFFWDNWYCPFLRVSFHPGNPGETIIQVYFECHVMEYNYFLTFSFNSQSLNLTIESTFYNWSLIFHEQKAHNISKMSKLLHW